MVVKPSAKLGGLSRLNNTYFTVFCERNFLLSIFTTDLRSIITYPPLHLSYYNPTAKCFFYILPHRLGA